MSKIMVLPETHVYVVLEHAGKKKEAKLHGVYVDETTALKKFAKLAEEGKLHGYLCTLKQSVRGKKPKVYIELIDNKTIRTRHQ